jgi:hypothetical protein
MTIAHCRSVTAIAQAGGEAACQRVLSRELLTTRVRREPRSSSLIRSASADVTQGAYPRQPRPGAPTCAASTAVIPNFSAIELISRPLRVVLVPVLDHHPHGTLANLTRIRLAISHRSILLKGSNLQEIRGGSIDDRGVDKGGRHRRSSVMLAAGSGGAIGTVLVIAVAYLRKGLN